MNKNVSVKGFCPTLNRDYQISVKYINADTSYIKGTFNCEYTELTNKCSVNDCPLYKSAKEEFLLR